MPWATSPEGWIWATLPDPSNCRLSTSLHYPQLLTCNCTSPPDVLASSAHHLSFPLFQLCGDRSHAQYFLSSDIQHCLSAPFFINLTKMLFQQWEREIYGVSLAKARLLVTTLSFLTPLPPPESIEVVFATHTHMIIIVIFASSPHHHRQHCTDFSFCWFLLTDFPSRLLMVSVVPR